MIETVLLVALLLVGAAFVASAYGAHILHQFALHECLSMRDEIGELRAQLRTGKLAGVELLRPEAGDSIVVSVPDRVTAHQRDQIHKYCRAALPAGVKVLVLGSGINLAHVVSPRTQPETVRHPADVMGYDAYRKQQIEAAHREYMERTSCLLLCDLKLIPAATIRSYLGDRRY